MATVYLLLMLLTIFQFTTLQSRTAFVHLASVQYHLGNLQCWRLSCTVVELRGVIELKRLPHRQSSYLTQAKQHKGNSCVSSAISPRNACLPHTCLHNSITTGLYTAFSLRQVSNATDNV